MHPLRVLVFLSRYTYLIQSKRSIKKLTFLDEIVVKCLLSESLHFVSTLFSSALIFRIFQGKIVRPSLSVPKGRMDFPPVALAKVTVAARFWETRK